MIGMPRSQDSAIDSMLTQYAPRRRTELEQLLASDGWQEAIRSGLVEEVAASRLEPGQTRDYISTVVDQLLETNERRVGDLIAAGCRDPERLLAELSSWRAGETATTLSFLGINLTAHCNFEPACQYCHQLQVPSTVGLDGWKRVIEEVSRNNERVGPYIYLTGGEPLSLGDELWGEDGLIQFATTRGAAVNVNTNGVLITPEVALRLIGVGLAKLHISLDAAEPQVQNVLFSGERMEGVLTGIDNMQLARQLVGASYPEIHTNCVLTNRNLDLFPRLFRFLLERKARVANRSEPLYGDLLPHVIPVGGSENDELRPSREAFRRFYEEVWPQVGRQWHDFQREMGTEEDKRTNLPGYFTNPFQRVEHTGGLEQYLELSAEGRYGTNALARRCYVAPTQASFTPDGLQFRCGSHAIRRIHPIGSATDESVLANIRKATGELESFPTEESCYGCALATLHINQAVESRLHDHLDALMAAA